MGGRANSSVWQTMSSKVSDSISELVNSARRELVPFFPTTYPPSHLAQGEASMVLPSEDESIGPSVGFCSISLNIWLKLQKLI